MKKYRVTALPKKQEGGSKKSKYDIDKTGSYSSDDLSDLYNEFQGKERFYKAMAAEQPDAGYPTTFEDYIDLVFQEKGEYPVARYDDKGDFTGYDIYDRSEIAKGIYNKGLRPLQLSKKMNLGPQDKLAKDFAPIIDQASYDFKVGTGTKAYEDVYSGKSKEEIIDDLVKKGMGTKQGLDNILGKFIDTSQDDAIKEFERRYSYDVPDAFREQIAKEREEFEKQNADYLGNLSNLQVQYQDSDTFAPYVERTADAQEKLGKAAPIDQSKLTTQYGTALMDYYNTIRSNPNMSKADKLKIYSDLEGSFSNKMLKEQAEAEREALLKMRGEFREDTRTDAEREAAKYDPRNPYRLAGITDKILHPIDYLGSMATGTDMLAEDPGRWAKDNLVVQALDAASYLNPYTSGLRGFQMIGEGLNLAKNTVDAADLDNRDVGMVDAIAPALLTGFGSMMAKPLKGYAKNAIKNYLNPSKIQGATNRLSGSFAPGMDDLMPKTKFGKLSEAAMTPLSFRDSEDVLFGKDEYALGGITKGKSKIQGDGMFTTKSFKKGEMIGLVHEDDQPATELGRMHNHDENSPTMVSKKIGNKRYVYASRDLKPGEELTTNYRMQPELEQPEDFDIPKAQIGRTIKKLSPRIEGLYEDLRPVVDFKRLDKDELSKLGNIKDIIRMREYAGLASDAKLKQLLNPPSDRLKLKNETEYNKRLRNFKRFENVTDEDLNILFPGFGGRKEITNRITEGYGPLRNVKNRLNTEDLISDTDLDVNPYEFYPSYSSISTPDAISRFRELSDNPLANLSEQGVDAFMDQGIDVGTLIPSLYAKDFATPSAMRTASTQQLSNLQNLPVGSIVTGADDLTIDSALMQNKYLTNMMKDPKKYGVFPEPIFLQYDRLGQEDFLTEGYFKKKIEDAKAELAMSDAPDDVKLKQLATLNKSLNEQRRDYYMTNLENIYNRAGMEQPFPVMEFKPDSPLKSLSQDADERFKFKTNRNFGLGPRMETRPSEIIIPYYGLGKVEQLDKNPFLRKEGGFVDPESDLIKFTEGAEFSESNVLPIAQRGRTMKNIAENLSEFYPHFTPVTGGVSSEPLKRLKSLENFVGSMAYRGMPNREDIVNLAEKEIIKEHGSTRGNWAAVESLADKIEGDFKVKRDQDVKKHINKLLAPTSSATTEDLVSFLGLPKYNPTYFDRTVYSGDMSEQQALSNLREMLNPANRENLYRKTSQAIEDLQGISLPERESLRYTRKDFLDDMKDLQRNDRDDRLNARTRYAMDLSPLEQPALRVDKDSLLNPYETVPTLYAKYYENPLTMAASTAKSMNRNFHNLSPGSLITGSMNTTEDSYLLQLRKMFDAIKKSEQSGVADYPMFLGYKRLGPGSFTSQVLRNLPNRLIPGYTRDHVQAKILQTRLDDLYNRYGIEDRLPVMLTQGRRDPTGLPTGRYHNIPNLSDKIMIPQFGVLKTKGSRFIDPEDRYMFEDGGVAATNPLQDVVSDPVVPVESNPPTGTGVTKGRKRLKRFLTPEAQASVDAGAGIGDIEGNFAQLPDTSGLTEEQLSVINDPMFQLDPTAYRGQVPGKFIRTQKKAGKAVDSSVGRPGLFPIRYPKGSPNIETPEINPYAESLPVTGYNYASDVPTENQRGPRMKKQGARNSAVNNFFANLVGNKGRGKRQYSNRTYFNKRIQEGGYIEAELDQNEILNLAKQGYIIEEI